MGQCNDSHVAVEAASSTCGGRTPTGASSSWTGQWPQPLSHLGMEYSLWTVAIVFFFTIFSQPPLPRFLQFPHSSRHLLLPFGTRQSKVRSFSPLSALSAPLNRSFTTGLLYRNHTFLLPAVRVTLLPPSSSSSRQPQLFPYTEDQLSIHRGPASPHSLRRSTPPATSEAEARGASTFQGPPTHDHHPPPSAPMNTRTREVKVRAKHIFRPVQLVRKFRKFNLSIFRYTIVNTAIFQCFNISILCNTVAK